MRYGSITEGRFVSRPNRFVATVEIAGRPETVHVKNTGRCRELLRPGCRVYLAGADTGISRSSPRKTAYDLVAAERADGRLVNLDSQAPNAVMRAWLEEQGRYRIRPEYSFGDSRIDFLVAEGDGETLIEVKGCTLIADDRGLFPDAPTLRGTRHLRELIRARRQGLGAAVAFVIQCDGISSVEPNSATDPDFAEAFEDARMAGVGIWFMQCHVEPDSLVITGRTVLS